MSDLEKFQREYQKVRPVYEIFVARLASLLGDLAAGENIAIVQVEHRAKTVESTLEKITRKRYANPFFEIKDLVGIRLITYYNDDVVRMASIIRREFAVDEQHSQDKIANLDIAEFGYRSFHLVCALNESRRDLPEWRQFPGFSAEIQVRSVLQHAWAAISHKLDYKAEQEVPADQRRQLFRLSALLELADNEFASLRDNLARAVESYRDSLYKGDLKIELNLDSLTEYFNNNVDSELWERTARSLGLSEASPNEEEFHREMRRLLNTLRMLDARTIADFDHLLTKHEPNMKPIIQQISSEAMKFGAAFEAWAPYLVHKVITIGEKTRLPPYFRWTSEYAPFAQRIMNQLINQRGNQSKGSDSIDC